MQTLTLAALLVYIFESLQRFRVDTWVFRIPFRRLSRSGSAASLAVLRNHVCAYVCSTLSPIGITISAPSWPCLMSRHGISNRTPHIPDRDAVVEASPRFMSWSDIYEIEIDQQVVVFNKSLRIETDSEDQAALAAGLAEKLRQLDLDVRTTCLSAALARHFDVGAAKSEVARLRRQTSLLRWTQVFFFVFVFGSFSAAALFSYPVPLLPFLVGLVLLFVTTAGVFLHTHIHLRPGRLLERVAHLASFLLPFHCLRGADLFWRRNLTRFHPLTLAAALEMKREDLHSLARPWFRAAWFPRVTETSCGEESEFLDLWRQALTHWAQSLGIAPDEYFSRAEGRTVSEYCPRCESEFRPGVETCVDCGLQVIRGR